MHASRQISRDLLLRAKAAPLQARSHDFSARLEDLRRLVLDANGGSSAPSKIIGQQPPSQATFIF